MALRFRLCLAGLIFAVLVPRAQSPWPGDTLWQVEAPIAAATLDKIGQAYLVLTNGELRKYDDAGQLKAMFSRRELGHLAHVDVSDPLQPMLWYPDYQTLVFLDRALTPYHSIRLSAETFPQPAVVALGRDNFVWVYDRYLHTLFRIDPQGRRTGASQDLSLNHAPPRDPALLVAYADGVYLADPATGIWYFDRLGQYRFTAPILGVDFLQPLPGQALLLRQNGTFFIYSGNPLEAPVALTFPVTCITLSIQGRKILAATSKKALLLQRP